MLADNIIFLKKNYPEIYNALKKNEESADQNSITQEDTRSSHKTLKVKQAEKFLYLHSKYDPIHEAEAIIDKLEEREDIDDKTHVVFYGLGLGYHIDAFVRRFPDTTFSLYEPSIEVFQHFLSLENINNLPMKKIHTIQCEYKPEAMDEFFNKLLSNTDEKTVIMDLPIYQSIFKEQYILFFDGFRAVVKSNRSSLNTNYAFKKRWVINSAINFKKVLNTPNIIIENNGVFKKKIAILVSAGPSLDYEIENLKLIKEKKLAHIFAVGSALNTLIHNNIYPDAMCTYDPLEENQAAFIKVNELNITTIPVIFGSSVGFETLQNYQGPKYHMITSQDTVSQFFLNLVNGEELVTVKDAPSIAVVTLELLHKLEFDQVILVGQNLAYKDGKHYAEGIDYQITIDKERDEHLIKAVDVSGDAILTSESFNSMRKQIEATIKNFDMVVINTTLGGAHIEGTQFMPMSDVISKKLKASILVGDEFKNILQSEIYDKVYLKVQLVKMTKAYESYQRLLTLLKQQLIKVDELVVNKNTKQSSLMYQKLDSLLVKLEANEFGKVFALPMNRVEHELLAINVQRIKINKNELKKIRELIAYVDPFINLLSCDSQLNQKIMEILTESIGSIFSEDQKKKF
ncbi:6-hydroxymethylpterin diphosphokinase MptE-like protein [Acetobacterium bakii]|uniref:6-hydroxymethylpterin diphosphokinase MptE-like domain-containing protein n=1 Tax=Acetobacterium bakii TaxID=52689 RepID=A0A0L6U4B1_9FIRM|nr:6-hydroxymethylpterin diphosphokinase MptE-like protein [Acetobacterium bakii]KNZ42655.1 hypothetical protein AKG39_05825 [Acetobacterium bakii]